MAEINLKPRTISKTTGSSSSSHLRALKRFSHERTKGSTEIEMPVPAPSPPRLQSPFIHRPINFTPSSFSARNLRSQATTYPRIKAELDPNTVVAISVGVASVALGIGIPVFYETQIDNAAKRENTQPCFPCNGTGAQKCRLCVGSGNVTVELGGGEKEVSNCINCDGAGSLTCTTCQGSGVQPRYLDRREFKDDD